MTEQHTTWCRCEGTRKDGTPCRKKFFAISALKGDTLHKCPACGHMNRFSFAYLDGHQYINGQRAERVEVV